MFSYTSRNILFAVYSSWGYTSANHSNNNFYRRIVANSQSQVGYIILSIRVYTMSAHSRNLISTKLPLHSKQPDNADKVPKYLAHQNRGCNRKVLLPLYSSLIRSILDYWSSVYGLAPHSHLSLLDPVQNAAISICTGAFRTCPQFSLCAEAGVSPLEYPPASLNGQLSPLNSATP